MKASEALRWALGAVEREMNLAVNLYPEEVRKLVMAKEALSYMEAAERSRDVETKKAVALLEAFEEKQAALIALERSRDELAREVLPYLAHLDNHACGRTPVLSKCTCGLDALLSRLDGGGK